MTNQERLDYIRNRVNARREAEANGTIGYHDTDIEDERNAARTHLGDDTIDADRWEMSLIMDTIFEGGQ